jgi:hypothetical protein
LRPLVIDLEDISPHAKLRLAHQAAVTIIALKRDRSRAGATGSSFWGHLLGTEILGSVAREGIGPEGVATIKLQGFVF